MRWMILLAVLGAPAAAADELVAQPEHADAVLEACLAENRIEPAETRRQLCMDALAARFTELEPDLAQGGKFGTDMFLAWALGAWERRLAQQEAHLRALFGDYGPRVADAYALEKARWQEWRDARCELAFSINSGAYAGTDAVACKLDLTARRWADLERIF